MKTTTFEELYRIASNTFPQLPKYCGDEETQKQIIAHGYRWELVFENPGYTTLNIFKHDKNNFREFNVKIQHNAVGT